MALPVTAFSSAFKTPLPAFSAAAATTEVPEPELLPEPDPLAELDPDPDPEDVFGFDEPSTGVTPGMLPAEAASAEVGRGITDPEALFTLAAIVTSPEDADEDAEEEHAVADIEACSV